MPEIILQTENLCVGYREHQVIKNINLSIEKGKVYSIIGPNGCGKTTLMRAISRSIKPTSGTVLLDGQNIFKMNTRLVAQKVAVLSQSNTSMSDITVRTLVQYGRFAHKKWWRGGSDKDTAIVEWALEKTGMTDYSNRRINSLSGGERQRAWIAMSIAQKPEILLLDEPTTYLDISHQLEIMELVARLNREEGITIVMVLHDINHAARYSDELIVLHEHHIWKQGEPWATLKSGVLRDVFRVDAVISKDEESGTPIFYAQKVVKNG
ncbi:MAG: ABC transporter ATP-binding protein [Oscillospiraceae bacterium]